MRATSKKVQTTRGTQVDAVRGLMCTQLLHTRNHVIPGESEESFGIEGGRSPIKGNLLKFLRTLVEYVRAYFNVFEWVGDVPKESWVEASSCLCERVFSHVTATVYGQSMERMCETLWVRCNGEATKD